MKYYIQDTRTFHGNAVVWWGIDGKGYTSQLEKAGKYTKADADNICKNRLTDVAWPCDYIDNDVKAKYTIVDMQYLDLKMRDRADVDAV